MYDTEKKSKVAMWPSILWIISLKTNGLNSLATMEESNIKSDLTTCCLKLILEPNTQMGWEWKSKIYSMNTATKGEADLFANTNARPITLKQKLQHQENDIKRSIQQDFKKL